MVVVVVVVWYLDPWQGNKTNSKYISARSLTSHGQLVKPHFAAHRGDARPFLPILKTGYFNQSSSPAIMGKPLKAPLGYIPTWVQMRRLENGQGPPKVGAFSLPLSRLRYLEEKRFRKRGNLRGREGEKEKREKRVEYRPSKILGIYIYIYLLCTLYLSLGYVPTWVQMRRLDLVESG